MNKIETKKSIEDLSKCSISDHIINIFKAVLSTTPFCGGLASLISDYIPSSKSKRITEYTRQIATDLKRLEDKVDVQTLQTDEFAHILESCYRGVAENYQKIKIELFRGILINSAIGHDIIADEKEYFLGLVSSFSVLHIRILLFMSSPKKYLNYYNIDERLIIGGFSEMFRVAIPETNIDVIRSAFGDLYQKGFLTTDKSIFSTMTSTHGLDLLGNRVADIGIRFIEFCTLN